MGGRDQVLQAGRAAGRLLLQCHRDIVRSDPHRGREDGEEEPGRRETAQAEHRPWLLSNRLDNREEWDGLLAWQASVIHTRDAGEIM